MCVEDEPPAMGAFFMGKKIGGHKTAFKENLYKSK
jgi:hypothetical protein